MLHTSTPLDRARAAIVQDLYQLAFCRQLTEASAEVPSSESWHLCDASIAKLLEDYAAVLRRTEHQADAELLVSVASQVAPVAQTI